MQIRKPVGANSAFVSIIASSALAMGVAACDLVRSGSSGPVSPIDAPDTEIVDTKVQDLRATFHYRSTIDGSTFKCANSAEGKEAEWVQCPSEGIEIALLGSTKYTFKVKAVSPDGIEDPTPAEVKFDANGTIDEPASLEVRGARELETARTGKVELVFSNPQFTAFVCELDGAVVGCNEGRYTVDLDSLSEGSHRISIAAVDNKGQTRATIINFCARTCSSGPGPRGGDALANELQLGDFYTFKVEQGMHVTEYSTTKTVAMLSFFRVLPQTDPNYLGNYKCDKDWDSVVSSRAPSGAGFDYCHSTPTRLAYKDTHEYRLANNHVEVSTDHAKVSETNHERISVSIYDADWEFMTARSRFNNLCMNATVKSNRIPMVNDFFIGRLPEEVTFWYCDAMIPARNGQTELWKVGAFIDIDQLDWDCDDCQYDRAVEVVYMARPDVRTWRDDYFAKMAQERIIKNLTKLKP